MIEMKLRSVGNPDFRQYAPISEPETIQVTTLKEATLACEAYIRKWDLGGGNWTCPTVKQDGKVIGRISYNGRFWTNADWKDVHSIGRKA